MTIKILLVDDRYLIQEGVKAILRNEAKIEIVGIASNGLEAIALSKKLKPDIVLLDIEMPKMNGIIATKYIRQVSPATKIIMLSSHDNPQYIAWALKAGASGYLLKESFTQDLKQAIYSLSRGYSYIEAKLLDKVVRQTKANNIVNSQKTKVYVHKYRRNIYTPATTSNPGKTPTNPPTANKSASGINRASLAPIFGLSDSNEIKTIDRLTASLKSTPTSIKKKSERQKNHNSKIILLVIAIASLILSVIIF